jgi:hypothetical protein
MMTRFIIFTALNIIRVSKKMKVLIETFRTYKIKVSLNIGIVEKWRKRFHWKGHFADCRRSGSPDTLRNLRNNNVVDERQTLRNLMGRIDNKCAGNQSNCVSTKIQLNVL